MEIDLKKLSTNFDGTRSYIHTRGAIAPNGFGLFTTQPLRLSGSDVFYGMYMSFTYDGGETWSKLKPSKTIVRQDLGEGKELAFTDATPLYHKKTGKIILIGHSVLYLNDEVFPDPRPRDMVYAVFNEEKMDFDEFIIADKPFGDDYEYFHWGNGSGQSYELPNGDVLVPVDYMNKTEAGDSWHSCYKTAVMRCSFDGKKLRVIEAGNSLTVDIIRGLGEPSVIENNGEYFLALRNDESGYVSKGNDGLHYEKPVELVFDDGKNVGNYCTQQHWIRGGGKLYLVYTRKGANNDYVFRHRAPLFIAEFDCKNMCLIRDTEKVLIPNRGARLGNFGCFSFDDGKTGFCFAAENMQANFPNISDWQQTAKYGSDGSIFIAKISF